LGSSRVKRSFYQNNIFCDLSRIIKGYSFGFDGPVSCPPGIQTGKKRRIIYRAQVIVLSPPCSGLANEIYYSAEVCGWRSPRDVFINFFIIKLIKL